MINGVELEERKKTVEPEDVFLWKLESIFKSESVTRRLKMLLQKYTTGNHLGDDEDQDCDSDCVDEDSDSSCDEDGFS